MIMLVLGLQVAALAIVPPHHNVEIAREPRVTCAPPPTGGALADLVKKPQAGANADAAAFAMRLARPFIAGCGAAGQ